MRWSQHVVHCRSADHNVLFGSFLVLMVLLILTLVSWPSLQRKCLIQIALKADLSLRIFSAYTTGLMAEFA